MATTDPYGLDPSKTPDSGDGLTPTLSYDGTLRSTPDTLSLNNPGGGYVAPAGFGAPTTPTAPTVTNSGVPGTLSPITPGQIGVGTGFQYSNPGFDDPASRQYFDLVSQFISKLTSPVQDPGGATADATIRQLLAQMFGGGTAITGGSTPTGGGQTGSLLGPNGAWQPGSGELGAPVSDGSGVGGSGIVDATAPTTAPGFQLNGPAGATGTGGDLGQYQGQIDQLIQQLKGPVFSDPNLAALKTKAFDSLNAQKQAEIQTTVRNLAQRGVPPSSPLVQNAIQDVNRRYDALAATQQQGLNTYEIGAQAAAPGQIASLAGARFGAGQTATNTGANLATTLASLSSAKRAEDIANYGKATGLAGTGVAMTQDALKNVLASVQGLTGSSDISSILNALMGVSNATNAQNTTSAKANSEWMQMLGQLLAQQGKT